MEDRHSHVASVDAAIEPGSAVAAPADIQVLAGGEPHSDAEHPSAPAFRPLKEALGLDFLESLAGQSEEGDVRLEIAEIGEVDAIPKGAKPGHILARILCESTDVIMANNPETQDELAERSVMALLYLDQESATPAHLRAKKAHCQAFGVSNRELDRQIEAAALAVRTMGAAAVARRHFPMPARCLSDKGLLARALGEAVLRLDRFNGTIQIQNRDGLRPLSAAMEGGLFERFKAQGSRKITRQAFRELLAAEARLRPYNAVESRIDHVTWDGVTRLERLLPEYLRTEDSPYHRELGRILVMAIVARALHPGCKMDFMPLLYGPQGMGKSGICKILAGGDEFFTELHGTRSINCRDSLDQIGGKLVVELTELEVFNNSSPEAVKAVITCGCDVYRSAYSSEIGRRPRSCIFIGTTNRARPISREMGGRRFYPIKIERHADNARLRTDLPQLMAEAKVRLGAYLAGNPERLNQTTESDYLWKLSDEADSERTRLLDTLTNGAQMVVELRKLLEANGQRLLGERGFILEDLVRSLGVDYRRNSPDHMAACEWLRENGFAHRRSRWRGRDGLVEVWYRRSAAAVPSPGA